MNHASKCIANLRTTPALTNPPTHDQRLSFHPQPTQPFIATSYTRYVDAAPLLVFFLHPLHHVSHIVDATPLFPARIIDGVTAFGYERT